MGLKKSNTLATALAKVLLLWKKWAISSDGAVENSG